METGEDLNGFDIFSTLANLVGDSVEEQCNVESVTDCESTEKIAQHPGKILPKLNTNPLKKNHLKKMDNNLCVKEKTPKIAPKMQESLAFCKDLNDSDIFNTLANLVGDSEGDSCIQTESLKANKISSSAKLTPTSLICSPLEKTNSKQDVREPCKIASKKEESSAFSGTRTCNPYLQLDNTRTTQLIPDPESTADSFATTRVLTGENKKRLLTSLKVKDGSASELHNGDTSSSEDEDNRTPFERSMSEYGRAMKKRIARAPNPGANEALSSKLKRLHTFSEPISKQDGVLEEPRTGVRISLLRVNINLLKDRLEGVRVVVMSTLKNVLKKGSIEEDWSTIGVLVRKLPPRLTKNGKPFTIWHMCDLGDCSNCVTLMLFGEAHEAHWKTSFGSVVCISNARAGDSRDNMPTLVVDAANKLLVLGMSKDLGICKSRKENGEKCTNFINTRNSQVCVYHILREHKKMSLKRSFMQAGSQPMPVNNSRNALLKKVLANGEVTYGGKLYTAKVARRNVEQEKKDQKRLVSLGGSKVLALASKLAKADAEQREQKNLETKPMQRVNPVESPVRPIEEKKSALQSLHPSSRNNCIQPKLTLQSSMIPRQSLTKKQALDWVKQNGPIKREMQTKRKEMIDEAKRQAVAARVEAQLSSTSCESLEIVGEPPAKKSQKEDFTKMLQAGSKHANLVDDFENDASKLYFTAHEKKEFLEQKMLTTFSIMSTCVNCKVCGYKASSPSELCLSEGHKIISIKAPKLFFECRNCRNRTTSFDPFPKHTCKRCGDSKWAKASMGKERKGPTLDSENLQIRGDEVKFLNSLKS